MMCKLFILISSVLGLIGVSVGQIIQNGQCDANIQLHANFNIEDFLGTWHEFATAEHPRGGDCSTIEFARVDNTITVYHKNVRQNFFGDYRGTATLETGTAKIALSLPEVSSNPIDFWVLNTDYTNFALVYGCQNIGTTQRQIFIWQLSREANLSEMIQALMNTAMNNLLGVSFNELKKIDHSEQACYELPKLEAGQPVILPGQCDQNIVPVANFNAGRFLGVWHEISSYYSENALGTCSRAEYSSEDGIVVNVVNSQVINRNLLTIKGSATVISTDGSGKLNVILEVAPGVFAESELMIIGTDYDNWAITYTCNNLENNQRRVFSWIVSRSRQLSAEAQQQVNAVVSSLLDLNYEYYETTDQTNDGCFYIPEPSNEPAVFGGQCDLNIPVQPNFDASQYLGLWHDTESYPTPFQFGKCNNAFYSIGEVGVDVFNTHVVNERLQTINGVAMPVGNEAKLVVTFPIEGTELTTETDYWIISTDYVSYSLVYSCRNINEYQQQITVWKLSRSKSLSQAANTAINNAMANQLVLDQRFFRPVDQTPEGCFYYPEPSGNPVVFPGQCENVPVVTNFNINLFQGTWYEVQAYPKEPQPGQCIRHEFSPSGTSMSVASNSVYDQLLGISSAQLTPTSGNEARFILTIDSTGTEQISFPYHIVATDYNNYALVYSCVNLNEDFRGIYSWKLSRSKQLTAAANTAISTVMEGIQTLGQEYFEDIDQSDSACFYFPDLAPGESVILPGQCDNNVPYVTNFNVEAYTGRWRMIESYPSDHQRGACNQATYTADGSSILVYNNEVADQALREINGVGTVILEGNSPVGKLTVTFPSIPNPFELWILATDYTSYSLVYGCENINTDQRQVWSWKLSRTTSLTTAANNAINAVVNNVNVLNDRYYQTVDQSDAACFYYPEPNNDATVIFRGQCDENIPVVMQFDPVGYMGLWHDVERYPAPFQFGTCGNAYYDLNTVLGIVNVYNTQVIGQRLDTINGVAVLDQVGPNDSSAKLLVTFPVGGIEITTPYWVLATDYNSYALVYSCTNIDDEHRSVTSWKLSRTKSLSSAANTAINSVTSTINVLDDRYYITQDQTPEGCFYFPEPQPQVPVVFPGQCDLNLNVMQNFDLSRFSGIWHEIEAYPKAEQPGQCINHQFTLNNAGSLNFQSSNVVDQTLGITTGTASFTSNDNSARLNLVFTSNGETITIPYWIVDTDYENYALAYSCVNLNSDFRGVWSWKLSRTKQLNAASVTAINNAIANVNVLDNVYYEPISQSDESCFYLPNLAPGEPVIIPGQCDASIPVVQDFDVQRYTGRWRMIESYPSDHQRGACNQATYTADGSSILVYNNEVADQALREINGVGTVILEGNSPVGKLSVTFPSIPNSFELWILATDYTSYSLVYGCENINSEQRRVFSWKLSRTTSLTTAANNAINAVVNNVNVLNDRFYQTIDQSDAACFYFPEPNNDATVVFRGQCDESIPVVMQFDPVGYMGLWHDVERYPAPFQFGTCGNAYYDLNTVLGIVNVYNTQVIGQRLDTINGVAVLDQVGPNDSSAKLLVTFPVGGIEITTPYWVLATDYNSYALVYSCTNIDDEHRSVTSWKLSRTKSLSSAANTAINSVTSTINVLDDRYYITQDQTPEGCFYFPEPQPQVPVVFPGQCDLNLNVMQNFDLSRFSGIWHEIEAYPKAEQPGQCINHQFTLNNAGSLNFQSSNVVDQTLGITTGTASFTSNDNSARLNLVFTSNGETITIPYWIVDTDYENYALAYSCVNQNSDFRGVWSWKLSRTKQLNAASVTAINNAIANVNVLDNVYYEPISQSDESCFYLPDLAPGEPVIIPGQCDASIPVVQDFDVQRYTGRWRMIESYPSDHQRGACNQATYTADGSSILVYNNEVADQALREINGVGTIILEGNSPVGKLSVTFPSIPNSFELWILATDYTSYSLVYGCENINSEQRRVFSWKLSRTTSLTTAANNAINAVVNNVNVLNDRFYQTIDQSDAACFYFPEPNNDATVVFRGQCDESIPVVMQFDPVGYMGLWHDVERYPAPFQFGTCGNAYYDLNTALGIVNVYNTQVIGQRLDTINGVAVLDQVGPNDSSAKLLVTFPVGGIEITTPYWVLATDYNSYALVYSCTNIDDEHRSVTSWKLSRTKSLSSAANTAINSVTSTINVLDDRYYITQDQTPEGCFYFPEPQPQVPVVFPGQCDLNLNVMQNFDLARFSGIWHEIEAYPKAEQPGQCINHQFTLNNAGSLNFQSSNVVDQTLGITTGTASFTSNDNSARLNLVFTSNGETITIPYWIVDTDYENYALAYSCVNQNSDFRGVWSWKLSRTKQLNAASVTAINNAIANVNVLDNVYYEPISQSDESCFYLPNLAPGEPVIIPGQCDASIPVVQDFDVQRYTGRWRMIESYPSDHQRGACNQATYTADGSSILVYNNEVADQALREINGVGTVILEGNSPVGKLSVTFPSIPNSFELWILATDYTSYSLVYGCENINLEQRRVFSWKLSRTTSLTTAANNAINAVVNNVNVLNDRYYQTVDQSDAACFYYPEPNNDATVIFRGQCDENIPVVMQFDPVGYMGLWHDVERYPAPFQFGTCGNAYYDLNTALGIVNVYNTQVIGQRLDTINGVAVLDQVGPNDSSAKLLVTFPVGGIEITTPYWVLATDYNSYALVYSCTNIDDEHRSVTSWKLSRTKSLSSAANTAINSVTSTINVLDDRYYITQDQTPEGCFYFPEPQPQVPVVFPGQCDLNLNVMQNFDLARFSGIWHEIEAYPKAEQPGQCINHQFTLNNAGSLNFQSSNVVDQTLGITTGTASFTSNDNSARLNLVFTSNGETITIPYWIVDTDYENYALAYSCVNQNSDFRGVWSWKLSRTKQLNAASVTAINNAIANVNVLDNVYYEPISQSDESCFYLPNLAPGEPVIIPGQCDASIPVVQDFDVQRYTGRWRMIESYPSDHQRGACNQATYTADGSSILVYNNEVADQALREINGVGTIILEGNSPVGKLSVTFPSIPNTFELWILATDYTSYSLVYGCENINSEQRRVFSWKLSRTTSLTTAANNAINAVVNNVNVLNDRYYQTIDQSDAACFYFPEPNGSPVIFRGQCDPNIAVVTGFDATRYTGVWYDLESYPAPFQDGSCGTATYTLDTETLVVSVENTQVVNQVLDVQKGTAVLASDNGDAKLLVTFEVNGVTITTDYWVLATDYDNYAFVYACQNINEEYRQVNSWKLSRTKTFTAAAQTAFTAAINRVQVLEERYFEDSKHSDEDCFFYPDNNGGDVVLEGQCLPDNLVPAITGFNAELFSNTWYEVARFPSDLQEGECTNIEYSVGSQNTVTITKTEVKDEFQAAAVVLGSLSNDGRGVITADIPGVPFNTFYILDTDYNEFALLYSCREIDNNYKQVYSWKLSRSQTGLSASASERIDNIVSNNVDLFEGYYSYTSQTSNACFHYPEFEELPEVIELIGPCDESIRGVPNFDAAAYLGRWIEIEKYPQLYQFGTCDRAYYSLGEDNVLVRNTQVIGDTLAEQLGYAEVASDDGSGQLKVTFVVDGITVLANYYILSTDYENYALVYSCRNLDNGNRQVSSWKLSRTTTLSAQATNAINAAIEQTQGLSQNYYQVTSQSEEDCFYIPEVDVNAAPVFRGQCESVTGVANFDTQAFAGWWHEIERYPVSNYLGECISSQYEIYNEGYQVVDTTVANGTSDVASGTVQILTDGRLRKTINGRTEDIWVLATDYETYALLYSCENIDSEYRRIWSAKHSKSRQLTQAAQTAMQPLIDSNRVLYNQFYQQVDQSDDACFHYPVVGGQQVILPGQCDDNIPVQQAFDVVAYGGTWYQIERYPQIHENPTSTCIGARYILDEATGVVSVLNWEVIEGELETIEGTATLSSNDGSAKLSVILPVIGTEDTVTTSLYVLETDYESYSLVYSCSNINNFQRSIGAWKLSREREMTYAGTNAIDRIINSRQELNQDYFLQVAHDEDCAEPSAGVLVKSSILVMIICALWQILS